MANFRLIGNSKEVLRALFDQKDEALEAMSLAVFSRMRRDSNNSFF